MQVAAAAQRPEVKWVPVKSEASQAVLSLHRMREQLKDMRRMQSNQLKALLYEFGVVVPVLVPVPAVAVAAVAALPTEARCRCSRFRFHQSR